MARPRIFISSTFFDLRQVRADLERFIKELGYDSVRNEMGEIPYGYEEKLEEYCYKEISEVDILVGIIGGRFGSEADQKNYSITQVEIKTAIEQDKQVYIFIDKNVYAEFQTYQLNKENDNIKYRFANDIRIYQFIEEITSLQRNNVIHPFETALDITLFLKEQWAGLFRDLLKNSSRRRQYGQVSQKVDELNEVAATLKTYLENVLKNVEKSKKDAEILIEKEDKRLIEATIKPKMKEISYVKHLIDFHGLTIDDIYLAIKNSESISEVRTKLSGIPTQKPSDYKCIFNIQYVNSINVARKLLNMPIFALTSQEQNEVDEKLKRQIQRAAFNSAKNRTTTPKQ